MIKNGKKNTSTVLNKIQIENFFKFRNIVISIFFKKFANVVHAVRFTLKKLIRHSFLKLNIVALSSSFFGLGERAAKPQA
jgi:hypothetical protein